MGLESDEVAEIRRSFERFATSFPDLRLYRRLAEGCAADPGIARLLLDAPSGQRRPVLFFAAVHDLVLRRPQLPLGRWYASVTPAAKLAGDDPWPTFRSTCRDHADVLRLSIATRTTQTNEVNRSVLVAALLASASMDVPGVPVTLVEVGSSAGLLLGFDRYRVDVGGVVVGDPSSSVQCHGEIRGAGHLDFSAFPVTISDRIGIDIDPVDIDDTDRVRWLEACLWPDQPSRLNRFRAAVELARIHQPTLVEGDAIDRLPSVIADRPDDTHLVVMNTWAMTYIERSRRSRLAEILSVASRNGRPVSWISAEPPGCVPAIIPPEDLETYGEGRPDTVLGVRRWREGNEPASTTLGWAHPHGNWIVPTP